MERPLNALAARSPTKRHGPTLVLDRVSFSVTPGSRIGVVGPNGTGKSTLLRLLAGLEEPDEGTIERAPRRGRSQLPGARRADEPPRPAGDRGARAGAGRVRGHRAARHGPPLPRAIPGDADGRALTARR